jgi:mannose-6-phosphate isomerase-like protein (cupin superfamily)
MDPLVAALRSEGLDPDAWSNGPGDVYAPHAHGYDKVLVAARGSIDFGLPDLGRSIRLEVGDRLDLPTGTRHDARVGPRGVTCLEAHLPAGSLGPDPAHRLAGTWQRGEETDGA